MPTHDGSRKRERSHREDFLRNRVTACLLLTGITPVALVHGLRFFWEDKLGLPGDHPAYRTMVAAFVLLLSTSLAWLLARRVIVLLREAGAQARTDAPEMGAAAEGAGKFGHPADSKGAAAETSRTEARLRAGLEGVGESGSDAFLLVCHASGRVWSVSRRCREWFGLDGDAEEEIHYSEVKTRLGEYLAGPEDFERVWERLASSRGGIGESPWTTKGANRRELVLTSTFHQTTDADDDGLRLWLFRDVTGESELRRELHLARKLESMGRRTGDLAHDLNNMLTGVIGNLSLVEADGPTEGVPTGRASPIECAKRAGQRAAELARHMFGPTRPQEDGAEWGIDVRAVIDEVVDLVGPTCEPPVAWKIKIDADLREVDGDETDLQQVFVNLCHNARDVLHGREDGEITIGARNRGESSDEVELSVTDNGSGIPPESRKQIFLPAFTRASSEETGGIGLVVAGDIVRKLGGSIECESEVGVGTTFRIRLPRRASAPGTGRHGLPIELGIGKGRHGMETILLVEDEELVRSVAESMLRRRGYLVRVANDGREALRLYDAAPTEIDLVLLDLTMPNLSGAATFQMLKARDAELPVIICSGYEVRRDRFESENGWCPEGVVQKPFDIEDLVSEVRRVLDAPAGLILGVAS